MTKEYCTICYMFSGEQNVLKGIGLFVKMYYNTKCEYYVKIK